MLRQSREKLNRELRRKERSFVKNNKKEKSTKYLDSNKVTKLKLGRKDKKRDFREDNLFEPPGDVEKISDLKLLSDIRVVGPNASLRQESKSREHVDDLVEDRVEEQVGDQNKYQDEDQVEQRVQLEWKNVREQLERKKNDFGQQQIEDDVPMDDTPLMEEEQENGSNIRISEESKEGWIRYGFIELRKDAVATCNRIDKIEKRLKIMENSSKNRPVFEPMNKWLRYEEENDVSLLPKLPLKKLKKLLAMEVNINDKNNAYKRQLVSIFYRNL